MTLRSLPSSALTVGVGSRVPWWGTPSSPSNCNSVVDWVERIVDPACGCVCPGDELLLVVAAGAVVVDGVGVSPLTPDPVAVDEAASVPMR